VNLKKALLIFVPLVLLFLGYKHFTKVDRSDPVAVATAFTKALRGNDISAASSFYDPASADAWREGIDTMRSGASERLMERVPESPTFAAPVTSKAGVTTIDSGGYVLEMKQLDGKWYVIKAPV